MMNYKMNILISTNIYPSKYEPNYGAFLYNLMQELARWNEITIIAPLKAHKLLKSTQSTYGNEACNVLRPLFISFSNRKFLGFNSGIISNYCFSITVKRTLNKTQFRPDIVYVHFLVNAVPVLDYVEKNKIPLVVASGESTYSGWENESIDIKNRFNKLVSHIICVSRENKIQLNKLGVDKNKLTVIPNAVNYELFKPLDKIVCKRKLGLDTNKFIVGFIGHFIHRKGPNRIIAAIETLNDDSIQLVCVGSKGKLKPNNFTTELAPVPNYQLPEIYNAFDVFVLPTLHEGHCNVIEEAKACGIPIISSKGTSVEEQIDENTGILVNPLNNADIASAISEMKSDINKRNLLSNNLLKKRGENSIQARARKINNILEMIVNNG